MAKMTWRKAPPALVERFAQIVPDDPRVERRSMFGYPCAFLGGNMFMGIFQESLFVRLGDEQRQELLARGGTVLEPMPGRPMKEYAVLPEALVDDDAEVGRWAGRALEHAAALPAKAKKPAAKKPAAKKLAAKKPAAKKPAAKKPAAKKPAAKKKR